MNMDACSGGCRDVHVDVCLCAHVKSCTNVSLCIWMQVWAYWHLHAHVHACARLSCSLGGMYRKETIMNKL